MYKLFFIIIFNIICLPSCTKVNPVDNTTENVQVESLYSEGEKHFLGRDVPQDYKKAFFYFEKAATAGSAAAQNDLAAMLTKGIGTDKNPEKVLFWLNKAAEQNFPEAQYNLANAYRDGVVVQKNEEKALELYLKAAEQNLPEAQNNAAYIYANTYNDLEKEKFWFTKSYENGNAAAGEALKELNELSSN